MGRVGGRAPRGLTDDPRELAEAARLHLREKFLRARVAVSGANFAVAETGTVVVVESEGNGRMCLTLPEVLITVMGIEKLVPTWRDLEVFLQLLPRSSTAERMNPYTSMWTGVTPGDGPRDFHLVLLDNGRTDVLSDATGRQALRCIRCSACLNVCPVYERTGGQAYGSVYPGPIGAILTPQLRGIAQGPGRRADRLAAVRLVAVRRLLRGLPGPDRHPGGPRPPARPGRPPVGGDPSPPDAASRSRCGRPPGRSARRGGSGSPSGSPGLAGRLLGRRGRLPRLPGPGPIGAWFGARDLKAPARESFRAWWRRTDGGRGGDR